jgi:flagellar hook-associated protein 2
MTTITPTTGTISSAGIGSGLDVNSIVTQLMAVERQPLPRLQTPAATMKTELSAFAQRP